MCGTLDNNRAWLATDGGLTYSSDNFTQTNNAQSKNNLLVGSDMWGLTKVGMKTSLLEEYHNGNTAIADFYQPKALRMGGTESPTGWVMKGKSRHVAFNDLGPGWILPTSAETSPEGRFLFLNIQIWTNMVVEEEIWFSILIITKLFI